MSSDLTVVVPTYNRPADLQRLVGFLRASAPALPVVVLDSSRDESARHRNALTCQPAGPLAQAHRSNVNDTVVRDAYPPDTPFYFKLCDGIRKHVKTPTICLCADDDLVIPEAIGKAAKLLLDNPDVAVAHGYYAQFTLVDGSRVTGLAYGGAEIPAEKPLHRVAEGLLNYEATLYAVQRTDVLVDILDEAAKAPSLLSAELTTTVLALAHGKARRIPVFTHARNIAPSHGYTNWHPAEAMSVDPASLVKAAGFIRERLTAHIAPANDDDLRVFDLAMLAYLADYIRPSTARRMTRMALEGRSLQEMRDAGWSDFTASLQGGGLVGMLRGSTPARWLKHALAHNHSLRERFLRLARNRGRPVPELSVTLAGDRNIAVKFEPGFIRRLAAISCSLGDVTTRRLAEAMALYCNGLEHETARSTVTQ